MRLTNRGCVVEIYIYIRITRHPDFECQVRIFCKPKIVKMRVDGSKSKLILDIYLAKLSHNAQWEALWRWRPFYGNRVIIGDKMSFGMDIWGRADLQAVRISKIGHVVTPNTQQINICSQMHRCHLVTIIRPLGVMVEVKFARHKSIISTLGLEIDDQNKGVKPSPSRIHWHKFT